jgi:predicted N-acyltransferase
MEWTHRLFGSVGEIDLADWERVRSACGNPIFGDPRFLAAVETGLGKSCRIWHVIVYDAALWPVACASFSIVAIDALDFADPQFAALIDRVPIAGARLRNIRLLLCGLPFSAGQNGLILSAPSDSPHILATLDQAACRLAADNKIDGIIYKEFAKDELLWAKPLCKLGYRCVDSLPMYYFKPDFRDFEHYFASLRANHRRLVNKSLRKRNSTGLEITILTDPRDIAHVYTSDVHGLYLQTYARSEYKLEFLTAEFFLEMASRLAGQVDLLLISKASKVVAAAWILRNNATCYLLYGGIDYALNLEADLYFNLVFASLEHALRAGVSRIQMGQTSSTFKARIGCYPEPLYMLVKGVGPLIGPFVRFFGHLLVAQEPTPPPFKAFKGDAPAT